MSDKRRLKDYLDRDFRFAFRVVMDGRKNELIEAKRPQMLEDGILLQRWSDNKDFWVGFFVNGALVVYDSDVIEQLADIIRARKKYVR